MSIESKEIWKDISWAEGYYSVSNLGRVRSNERTIIRSNGRPIHVKECILNPTKVNRDKDLVTTIRTSKKRYRVKVRRLVAEAFLGLNIKDVSIDVIHKDGDYTNCSADNLKLIKHRKLCKILATKYKPSDALKIPVCCENKKSGKKRHFKSVKEAAHYANISAFAMTARIARGSIINDECFTKRLQPT